MGDEGDDELMWGRLGRRDERTVVVDRKGMVCRVSKLFRDVPDGRLFERYSRRHTPVYYSREKTCEPRRLTVKDVSGRANARL